MELIDCQCDICANIDVGRRLICGYDNAWNPNKAALECDGTCALDSPVWMHQNYLAKSTCN